MKKILVFALSVFAFSTATVAQTIEKSAVPAAIMNVFNTAYMSPEDVKWEMDYDNYVAHFQKNKTEVIVTYNKDGKWVMTETPVTHKSLPAAVKSCLTRQFDIYKENDIEKVDKPDGVCYEIDVEYNQMNYEVVIAENGELIRKDQVKEYKKD
ncbi:MAG: hypothetical protein JWO09_352 [Bacteroidetes bacterium]|nr:hypothetical protein [Bacteroidota bacterium]